MPDELSNLKRLFLQNEILTLTINGALASHSTIYSALAEDGDKKRLRETIRNRLPKLARTYCDGQTPESTHIENIESLAKGLTIEFGYVLEGRRFRIGIAQKLLNLYLKYCWTLGWNPEPPHCPFDGEIIRALSLEKPMNWTETDSVDDYRRLVDAARERGKTCNLSIACWELKQWQSGSGRGFALDP